VIGYLTYEEAKTSAARFRKAGLPVDPYVRIVIAKHEGKGVRLSAEEVWMLAADDAIQMAACNAWDEESQ
jgi:hypothetical protein